MICSCSNSFSSVCKKHFLQPHRLYLRTTNRDHLQGSFIRPNKLYNYISPNICLPVPRRPQTMVAGKKPLPDAKWKRSLLPVHKHFGFFSHALRIIESTCDPNQLLIHHEYSCTNKMKHTKSCRSISPMNFMQLHNSPLLNESFSSSRGSRRNLIAI